VFGLKALRYSDIESNIDALLKRAKAAFFYSDGEAKAFTKSGGALTLLPRGSEGVKVISSIDSLNDRFRKFKARAIMAGRVGNIGLPEHKPQGAKTKYGLPVVREPSYTTGMLKAEMAFSKAWLLHKVAATTW
jgi:hypothetical protein